MTHDEMIAVITHHKNGGKVQYSCKNDDYDDVPDPTWNFAMFDYRAKQEPCVLYADFNDNENSHFCSREKYTPPFGRKLRKFVEVEQ